MQLNVSTCYGLQIILYLSRNKKVVSSTELSNNLHISQRYILQIVQKLRDGALVNAHAGMKGGYSLSKEESAISVYDIVALMEGASDIPFCIKPCHDANLHCALSAMSDYLDTYLKTLTFDKLTDMDTTGRLSEIIAIAETNMNALKQGALVG